MKRTASFSSIEPELLSLAELRVMFGNRSRQWVYNQLRSNPAFPKPVKIDMRQNAWRVRDVRAYIDALPPHELTGLPAPENRVALAKRAVV